MISKEEVLKIAKLARLELTENEVEKMQKDLSSILDYFELLKKSPKLEDLISNNANIPVNNTRKDEIIEKPASFANNLVQRAPNTKERHIKVKSIL